MLISTVVFLFFLFLVYALFLLASRKTDARQERLQQRVAEALRGLSSSDEAIQISRDDSIGGHPVINRLLSSLDFKSDGWPCGVYSDESSVRNFIRRRGR